MKIFKDQLGHIITLKHTPKRIISLVPSQTELLYDLGLENNIVGITRFCVHPYHFKTTKKIIGGTKKVQVEKIKLLEPDLIIANKEENTKEIVAILREIAPVWVTDIITMQDNLDMIQQLGAVCSRRIEAQRLVDKIHFVYEDFKQFIKERSSVKVAYFIWKNPYMVAGSSNFINELLKLNKFQNIYDKGTRYPEIEVKKIRMEGDPDIIFLSSEPFPFKDEDAFEIGRFTHHAKTVFVDGEMFSWYGSHVLKAFEYFKKLHLRLVPE